MDDDQERPDSDDEGEMADDEDELAEPTVFPDDRGCAVCQMVAADYPDWNAQVVHADGHREYFCSAGCLAGYYPDPTAFGGPETDIEGVWVTDVETQELIDASSASFVRVTDTDHVDDIMMRNPTPFADRADAEAFVDGFDAYDTDDIITLSAFDAELAELYRGRFFVEDGDDSDDHH